MSLFLLEIHGGLISHCMFTFCLLNASSFIYPLTRLGLPYVSLSGMFGAHYYYILSLSCILWLLLPCVLCYIRAYAGKSAPGKSFYSQIHLAVFVSFPISLLRNRVHAHKLVMR